MKKFHTASQAIGNELEFQIGAAVGYHGSFNQRKDWLLTADESGWLDKYQLAHFRGGVEHGTRKRAEDEAAGKVVRL